MTPQEYTAGALRTEKKVLPFEGTNGVTPRIEHAIIGLASEIGELADAMKKAKFYGKTFDVVNFLEELGDLTWYIAIALDETDSCWEEIWEKNIAKLKARYPEKYTDENALCRNLEIERKILES